MTKLLGRFPLLVATIACASAPAFASPIAVSNYSFETLPVGGLPFTLCGPGCSYSAGAIPGWNLTGAGGQFQPGAVVGGNYFTSLSDGPTNAYDDTEGGIISQTVLPTVVLGQAYLLQVDIGFRLDERFYGTADLLINGNRYDAVGVTPDPGTFATFAANYTGLLADVGQTITIELRSTGPQANFDNVRLDALATEAPGTAPEPASFLLIGSAMLAIGARRRWMAPRG
jgi:hypothetical protein